MGRGRRPRPARVLPPGAAQPQRGAPARRGGLDSPGPAAAPAGPRPDGARRRRARRPARARARGARRHRRRRVLAPRAARRAGAAGPGRGRLRPARGPARRGAVRHRGDVLLRLAPRAGRRPPVRRGDERPDRGHVAGDQAARQLDGHRPGARPAGAQASHRREAADRAGGGPPGLADRHPLPRRRRPRGAPRRHPGEGPRPDRRRLGGRAIGDADGDDGDPARLPATRVHLAGRADRRRPRRLPGRRHGPGQDRHPDRAAPAPARARPGVGSRRWWSVRPA